MAGVSGVGSWPGEDVGEALRVVRGELTAGPEGVVPVPYLPELPARGPGADLVGRSAGLLVDLPVDLQPQGWRLVGRPGLDADRTAALWRRDLDELAEAFDGWSGPLKLQVSGPWTLAASLWLPRGDRVLADHGAVADLASSLADGAEQHLRAVQRLLPAAQLVLQVDEPSLPAVLRGSVRSDSGYRTLPAPEASVAEGVLRSMLHQARAGGATSVVLHCCGDGPPLSVLRAAGADGLSVDTRSLGAAGWESLATAAEAGQQVWAGALPATAATPPPGVVVDGLAARWRDLGLETRRLDDLVVTPACGLAGAVPEQALTTTRACLEVARELHQRAQG